MKDYPFESMHIWVTKKGRYMSLQIHRKDESPRVDGSVFLIFKSSDLKGAIKRVALPSEVLTLYPWLCRSKPPSLNKLSEVLYSELWALNQKTQLTPTTPCTSDAKTKKRNRAGGVRMGRP